VATARPGDPIHYTLRLAHTAGGTLPLGAQLVDTLPPEVTLTGLRASLGGGPATAIACPAPGLMGGPMGDFVVDCPGPGERTPVSVKLGSAAPLTGPFTVAIDVRVRDDAAGDVVNLAQLLPITQNVGLDSLPSLVRLSANGPFTLRADRALAARGDLVPL